ncbi:MAG TPA: AtpZ/AtpI family protein [Spongiibacteraceae bacterium]|nr:AtpZ/AtpI family protein [Spongiibacteraceae bacterium]
MSDTDKLEKEIEHQGQRLRKAERERHSLLAETAYVGVLGLVFVLPVIAGAYFGRWLDSQFEGYSMRWTLSMLMLGIAIGAYSVYRNLRN